jgi:hypothetical protein
MNTPHYYRRQSIHAVLLCLIVIIALLAARCRPQKGCYGTRGMSGYGWLKNTETKKVFILDSNWGIICTFTDPKDMFHLKYE